MGDGEDWQEGECEKAGQGGGKGCRVVLQVQVIQLENIFQVSTYHRWTIYLKSESIPALRIWEGSHSVRDGR